MSQVKSPRRWLAERPYILAALISLLLILWMASGVMQAKSMETKTAKKTAPLAKVQVTKMHAEQVSNSVDLYGRTEPNRTATLKAELKGKVTQVLAKRGSVVKQGQVIAKIALNDLNQQLTKAKALQQQRQIEYDGARSLNKDGYQGEAQLSAAFAALEAVKADIAQLEIAIANSEVKAPFDGVLNTRYVEVGDYVGIGDNIALIADLNPLIVRAFATEHQVAQLAVGQSATVRLLAQSAPEGQIRYIASIAEEHTNTFKIEVEIDNPNNHLLAGISGELSIPLAEVAAIKLTPALLALDEQGNIGVKSVRNDQVVFTPINIVKTESDGMWLSGLGEQADVITLGQGFVRAGDKVVAVFADSDK